MPALVRLQGANYATVTVATLTCNVPTTLSLATFKNGDFVEIKCTSSAGTNTLTSIKGKGDHD